VKIAFVSTMEGAPWGGSEELWSRVALRLAADGHRILANVVHWPHEAPALAALRAGGIKVSTRSASHRLRHRLLKRVRGDSGRDWLRRTQPELLIISQGGNLDGMVWMRHAADLRIPYVTIAQMADDNQWPHQEVSAAAAAGYHQALQCFFVSRGNLRTTEMQLACRLPQGSVVFNPVNLPPDLSLPTPWPSSGDGIYRLATVGRLAPAAKGQDLVLQVLDLPKWRERPVQVSFYGDGYFKHTLERLIKMMDLPNVRLAGHASRVDEIWSAHHALLMPSRHEGLPLALVEAMLCGRFGIVTDVAGNAELLTDNQTGFVAAAPKPACLDEAMERAWRLRDRWREVGLAAAAQVRTLLPADPIADFVHRLNLPSAAPLPAGR
jgi:glycosyltransferase involved in cell wall biosynthesis